ncbi:hypothetical protein D6_0183 [Aeromonas phage D6]|uniref:Lysozyme inhibitor LprI-like N-terminal domain-containing protein n=1 Tax=Aeromonas phage D6 TaxID=2593322 RepID=A0A514TWE7_9CAUD|nr:hypothetical protein PQC08_gp092 [Aeromonas phage D6]QDJ97342.1 hypothetical protein D6_0183 [Aeromonas phage D6]
MKKIIIATLFFVPFFGNAASFDCRKATTVIEKTICEDEVVSKLDEEVAKVYKAVRQANPGDQDIINQQRDWIKSRNKATSVVELEEKHRDRLDVLNIMLKASNEPQAMKRDNAGPVAMKRGDAPVKTQEQKTKPVKKGTIAELDDMAKQVSETGYYVDPKGMKFDGRTLGAGINGFPGWCAQRVNRVTDTLVLQMVKTDEERAAFVKHSSMFRIVMGNMMLESAKMTTEKMGVPFDANNFCFNLDV